MRRRSGRSNSSLDLRSGASGHVLDDFAKQPFLQTPMKVPAHFAEKNRLLEAGFAFAGFFALLITTMSAVYGILIADSDRAPRSPALRTGLVLGLVLSFAMTLVVTGYIIQAGGLVKAMRKLNGLD